DDETGIQVERSPCHSRHALAQVARPLLPDLGCWLKCRQWSGLGEVHDDTGHLYATTELIGVQQKRSCQLSRASSAILRNEPSLGVSRHGWPTEDQEATVI